jgi:hypothetical protein
VELRDGDHLAEEQSFDHRVARLRFEHRAQTVQRERDRVLPEPGPCRVRGSPVEHDPCVQIAEAAELQRVVGRLEADHELSLVDEAGRLEDIRQRVLDGPELLAWKEQERDVIGELRLGGPAGELDHHRKTALHVTRAESDDPAVLNASGQVALGRNRVHVPCEQHQGLCVPFRVDGRLAVRPHLGQGYTCTGIQVHMGLGSGLRGDVDEVESALRECHNS